MEYSNVALYKIRKLESFGYELEYVDNVAVLTRTADIYRDDRDKYAKVSPLGQVTWHYRSRDVLRYILESRGTYEEALLNCYNPEDAHVHLSKHAEDVKNIVSKLFTDIPELK